MNKEYGDILPKKIYIIGYNDENISLYNSSASYDSTLIIKESEKCDNDKIKVISSGEPENVIKEDILKGKLTVILNTGCDGENIRVCKGIIEHLKFITKNGENDALIRELFQSFKLFVIGTDEHKDRYESIEDESLGCIRYINRLTNLAFDFIDNYPIARFIPRDKILPDTTIEGSFNINVIMVGFNELNQKILTSSIANNQFLTRDSEGELIPKLVEYKILGEGVDNSIKSTLPSFRYEKELIRYDENGKIIQSSDYLELPPPPANTEFIDVKLDTGALISRISPLLSDKNALSLVIIDYSSEEQNLRLARAITELDILKESKNCVRIFARAGDIGSPIIYSYGLNSDFLDIEHLIEDRIYNMAIERNRIYTLESEYLKDIADGSFDGDYDDIIALADSKWYTKRSYTDKASNIYAMLSIRSKLNLLGLDYIDADSPAQEFACYDEIYTKGEIRYLDNITVMGRRVPLEMTYEFTPSVRGILAHQEHYRWNSFMISMGYIPATINAILNEKNTNLSYTNGKNTILKRHGNITTAEGLIKYRQLLALRDECSETEKDVICYDYQLMDDVVWLLKRNGYKIVRRENEND